MSIIGFSEVKWITSDVEAATSFFVDFGLPIFSKIIDLSQFQLEDGTKLVLTKADREMSPNSAISSGISEVIWAVDTQDNFDGLVTRLEQGGYQVSIDGGVARFLTPSGIAYGLRLHQRKQVTYAPDQVNAAGCIRRLNQHRKWRLQARPKTLNHAVFLLPDSLIDAEIDFHRTLLNFRITDVQEGVGTYVRADGTFEHHTLLLGRSSIAGKNEALFNHAAFGVEDIDELMTGSNLMARRKWKRGYLGDGRHRIGSALHSYWSVPGSNGAEAEFSADSDYLDDNWRPRRWGRYFGQWMWSGSLKDYPDQDLEWDCEYLGDVSGEFKI